MSRDLTSLIEQATDDIRLATECGPAAVGDHEWYDPQQILDALAAARAEGFRAGMERAADIVELIPMLTGEQAHKIAERIRNEEDR